MWAFGVVVGLIGALAAAIELLHMIGGGGALDLEPLLLCAASATIHLQTFRVLRDAEVKRHVMAA